MNKNAIKKFAIEARQKLIASVTDKAGMLGITAEGVSAPTTKCNDFEVYQTAAGTEVTLNKKQCEQRRRLVEQIETKGFEEVVEEVAYTWFNRICAIRFMEVNDYLPSRVRVLSSEKEGKNEPDLVTQAPNVELDLTDAEKEFVIESKMSGKLDELFAMLFVKQCNKLHEVLPELFEETSDYTEMLLSISFTNKDDVIRMLIDEVPEEDFNIITTDENGNVPGQVEIIGWLYQYYNTELKDDTFAKLKKNIKITKERIPAATQLFTPDWIVRYMVENSVGRLWIEHLRAVDPSVDEKKTAEEFGWKYYLPEAEQEESVNQQLATIRADYKNLTPEDITCIDPCMGSGHILVAMFDVLMDIYKSAGYSERDAALLIVQKNICGLDIDKRAYQLAYFAVMMKGRQYNRKFLKVGYELPTPVLSVINDSSEIKKEHIKYFGTNLSDKSRLKAESQMNKLLSVLQNAKEYGSILKFDDVYDWNLLHKFVEKYLISDQLNLFNVGIEVTQKQLNRLIIQTKILTNNYYVTVTNPPYMGAKKMNKLLVDYTKTYYPNSKTDMFAIFIEKCNEMTKCDGYQAMITQHAWMFLDSFKCLREKILQNIIVNMAHLGTRAFDEIGGEVVQTTAFILRKHDENRYIGNYSRLVNQLSQNEKRDAYLSLEYLYSIRQDSFQNIDSLQIAYWLGEKALHVFRKNKIYDFADACYGFITGNNERYLRLWYEVDWKDICFDSTDVESFNAKYAPCNKGGLFRKWYGNNQYIAYWGKNDEFHRNGSTYQYAFFHEGITWSVLSSNKFNARFYDNGYVFDHAAASLFVHSHEDIYYILGYLNCCVFDFLLTAMNPTINSGAEIVSQIPILDVERDQISKLSKECVDLCKNDWNIFEISWNYRRDPLVEMALNNRDDVPCIDKLIEELDLYIKEKLNIVKQNEEKINRIFIDAYGLHGELTEEVDEKDVSIHVLVPSERIKNLISFAVGCMFGRYSLKQEGLIYAGGKWNENQYIEFLPDVDNVIPTTDEEYFEDDIIDIFCRWLRSVFGSTNFEYNLEYISSQLNNKGNSPREIIRSYFVKDFISDHMKMYQNRPIYWLFDSGKENGFKALIYMHRYTPDTVGIVRTDYLHKTQKAIEQAMQRSEYSKENASTALDKKKAMQQITKYTKQLAELKIYDEAMAHIANQRIEIDLDDGVKVNYAKFQGVEVAQEGKKALKIDLLAKIK